MAFTKLDSSLTDSTIWQQPDGVRLVWITMLAMADQYGYVGASVPGLAGRARVDLEVCIDALERFKGPDKYSRTPDNEGRRIADAEGGWVLLNYSKYRAKQNAEDKRERSRLGMQALRRKQAREMAEALEKAAAIEGKPSVKNGLTKVNALTVLPQAEAEEEADTQPPPSSRVSPLQNALTKLEVLTENPPAEAPAPAPPPPPPDDDVVKEAEKPADVSAQTWADFHKHRKAKKAPVTQTVLNRAAIEAGKAGITLDNFLQIWCSRGSQGLMASWIREDEFASVGKVIEKPAPASFRQTDLAEKRRAWEEQTGRKWPGTEGDTPAIEGPK